MKKYKVIVKTRGKLIFFKNKEIRSPFTLDVADSELELLRSTLISSAIDKYEIEEIKDTNTNPDDDFWEDIIVPKEKDIPIEELCVEQGEEKEPSTLLEKLLRDEKNGE
jgi:hypothetical protein